MAKRAIFPLPLLLAGLLLLQTALIGCHGNKAETDTTHTETASTDTETVPEPVPVYPDSLPDGLDLGGMTVTMACRDGRDLIYCIGNEESVGEMVQDAIFERNMAVEERLNVVFGRYQYDKSWGEWGKYINTVVLAGEDAFQICFMENNSLLQDGAVLNPSATCPTTRISTSKSRIGGRTASAACPSTAKATICSWETSLCPIISKFF